jgi:DNA-binding response OmpR family regulator
MAVGTRKRALVVDDDDPIRMMLAKIVERQELTVDTARDGVEAIQQIDRDHYDLILLDLMMPRIDGYGVVKHIQEHHPERLGCTIIASAVPENEVLRKIDIPVFRIHAKPFDLQKLIADIRECVNGGR